MTASSVSAGHRAVYDALVALHVLCAVVGFGAVAVSGAYGALGRRSPGSQPVEELRRYFSHPGRAEYLILAVPVVGGVAMGVRPGGSDIGDLWIVAGSVVWLLGAALLVGVVRPAEGRIRAALRDPEHARGPAGRLMWAAAASDVLFVVALVLMVTQPA